MKKDRLGHLIAALFRREKQECPMARGRAERLLTALRKQIDRKNPPPVPKKG